MSVKVQLQSTWIRVAICGLGDLDDCIEETLGNDISSIDQRLQALCRVPLLRDNMRRPLGVVLSQELDVELLKAVLNCRQGPAL